jgi:hypothetical protein
VSKKRYGIQTFFSTTAQPKRNAMPFITKKGPVNIPVKTAIHVSYAVMIAAAYALVKNPATVKNIRKGGNHESP